MSLSDLSWLSSVTAILRQRGQQYGDARRTFERIAARWSDQLGITVTPLQVCQMMADLKMVRWTAGQAGSANADNPMDALGCIALAEMFMPEPPEPPADPQKEWVE